MKAAGLLLAVGALACSRAPTGDREEPPLAPPSAALQSAAPPISAAPAKAPPDISPIERSLELAAIVAIAPRAGSALGVFDATVRIETHTVPARLTLALTDDPQALRRPLAFYKLARALGAHVVPVSVLRRESAGSIAELLQPDLLLALKPRLAIQNDGTVDALLTTVGPIDAPWSAPQGTPIAVNGSAEIDALARRASSAIPLPGERPRLLRDFVEMIALDYLSANVLRRTAVLDAVAGALVLDDNATAFPLHVDPRAEARLLNLLRSSARFPKNLRSALETFDRAKATSTLAPGSFEGWLISPRSLVALDERRVSLLSLLDAKIAASSGGGAAAGTSSPSGQAAVLSL
jgi:hypothetical protein